MIAQLTRNERQLAILISLVVAVVGLMLGIAGRNDPIGLHGALIFVAGLLVIALIGRDYLAPEPSEDAADAILRRPDQCRHRARDDMGRVRTCHR